MSLANEKEAYSTGLHYIELVNHFHTVSLRDTMTNNNLDATKRLLLFRGSEILARTSEPQSRRNR